MVSAYDEHPGHGHNVDAEKNSTPRKVITDIDVDSISSQSNDLVLHQINAESDAQNVFMAEALHVLVGARLFNTLSNSARCTVIFGIVTACICFAFTLPRTLSQMSYLGVFSAVTMGIAVLLAMIFAGVQSHPAGYILGSEPIVTVIPVKGTGFVGGMSAFLNITYTFVGQATLPSFIAEMKNPKDFPKGESWSLQTRVLFQIRHPPPPLALWAVTIAEIITFTLCGALVYHFVGNQYMTAPAFGRSLFLRNRPLHLLPTIPKLETSKLKLHSRMDDLGFHHRSDLGYRVRPSTGDPILLRHAKSRIISFRRVVRVHILGNGLPSSSSRTKEMERHTQIP
ncbi:hypothetical protein H0H93_011984 [Arthromyces matolae]|nr:hypothetical protein H0H93_011984 [Arthromyces matolae]